MAEDRSVLELLRRTYQKWHADGAPQIAAALTYYVFLSLAPLLVLLVGVLGRYMGRVTVAEQVLEQSRSIAGTLGEQFVREIVSAAAPTTMNVAGSLVAMAVAFTGAMRMFRQLRIAFDRMWDIPAEGPPGAGIWEQVKWGLSALGRDNLAAFVIVLAVGGLMIASLVLSSVVAVAAGWIAPILEIGPATLNVFDTILSAGLVTVLIALIYRFLPRASVGWKDVWVGAVMTALLFMAGRALLGLYFTYASPGSAYGAAGSVAAVLIWVNVSLQLMLFGAEFTHAWAFMYGTRASSDPMPGVVRQAPGAPEREPGSPTG